MDIENKSIIEIVVELIKDASNFTRNERKCNGISDQDFILLGVVRVLNESKSGRDFLQKIKQGAFPGIEEIENKLKVPRSTFFDALSSKRRCKYITETAEAIDKIISNYLDNAGINYLSGFDELDGRDVYSGDGHYIKHATHTAEIKGKYPNSGTIYMQNIRNGSVVPMCVVESETSSKPNEITFIRDNIASFAKNNALEKPLIVYDMACVDNVFWTLVESRRKNGCHIVTRLKKNIIFTFKTPIQFDKNDPVNMGIQEYATVGMNNAGVMYYVKYKDVETGDIYEFITTDSSLRPGVVVYIYKVRWKLEKVYDVFKNKLFEVKAWGRNKNAHESQSALIATTYNIMRMLLAVLDSKHTTYGFYYETNL